MSASAAIRPRRSVLYMPGSNARAIEKARTLSADAVILDLEDAVAPDAKESAREQVVAAVTAGGFGRREVVIRVNGLDTPWGHDDLVAAASSGADAVLIPKVSDPETIGAVELALATARAPDALRVWAMIETPVAILHAEEIARAARHETARLACFVLGTNDIAKETRARFVPGRWTMLPWLTTVLAAARAHGLDVLDGVYNNLQDAEGFRAECEQGRDLGMDGKTLIHPNQIAVANEVFAPAAAEVEAARKIIAAFDLPENSGRGVISLDGRMVERMHADMAARTVALAEAIAAAG
ncbi:HpcH/HpaI aldolase/citrate lyase family protein [Enterovirga sp. CN4-39]|uniref:HpcH/HpaI aldolase/citrate lyase family protein n=1 Tax=Enterovirga sp. CN4-39 TaxID=3400910 RepID=UPI003C09ED1C